MRVVCDNGTMKEFDQPIGDMRLTATRTKSGETVVKVRLLTSAEVRWHTVRIPQGAPAYALYEACAQEAIRKFASVPGATETWMQCPLPV